MLAVGIDLGGSNLRAAIYGDDPTVALASHREPVGDERSPKPIARRLAQLIDRLVAEVNADGAPVCVGIGLAAMLKGTDGTVANSPHLRWRDVAFGALLAVELGDRPFVVYNDVDAVTYGEYRAGAARGHADTIAVFVGTGIGAGIVANGELVRGSSCCAGEIGHLKVVYGDSAASCACGSRGCVEAYAGGHNLQARARRELAAGMHSLALDLAGGDPSQVTPGHVDEAAAQGDAYALDLYEEVAPLLGATLANVITFLNPSCLLLGGGMLSRTPIFRDHVVTALQIAVNPPALVGLTIVDSALGDDAGLVGSALLARQQLAR